MTPLQRLFKKYYTWYIVISLNAIVPRIITNNCVCVLLEMPQLLLQTSPQEFKGNFTQKVWPCPAGRIANVEDRFQTIYGRPRMERPTFHLREQQVWIEAESLIDTSCVVNRWFCEKVFALFSNFVLGGGCLFFEGCLIGQPIKSSSDGPSNIGQNNRATWPCVKK